MVSYDYASPQVIAPVLGVMLSVTRSCIPVREVAAARKERRLGVRFCITVAALQLSAENFPA